MGLYYYNLPPRRVILLLFLQTEFFISFKCCFECGAKKTRTGKNNFSFPVPMKLPPLLFGAFFSPYIHNKHLKLERWRNIIYNNFIFSPSHALRNWWAVSRNRLPSPLQPSHFYFYFYFLLPSPDLVVYSGSQQSICLCCAPTIFICYIINSFLDEGGRRWMGGLGRGFIHFADELVMNSDAMSHIYLFFLSY